MRSILDDIFKHRLEVLRGRIMSTPGNWVFEPTQAQIERTKARNQYMLHESVDADGKPIYLIKQRGVHCTRAELCNGKYPKAKDGEYWYIPLYVCRKCEFHQKGKRRGTPRYPCCTYRANKDAERSAITDVLQVLSDAKKFADDLMA
jgi:hypothetical protein